MKECADWIYVKNFNEQKFCVSLWEKQRYIGNLLNNVY
jgi:hypothetical protein